jgi:hypothetical protein
MDDAQYFAPGSPNLEPPEALSTSSEEPNPNPRPPRPEMPPLGPEEPRLPPPDPDPEPFPQQRPGTTTGWSAMQWIANPGRGILGMNFGDLQRI